MSDDQPTTYAPLPPTGPEASSRVTAPAMALLVTGILGVLAHVLWLLLIVLGVGASVLGGHGGDRASALVGGGFWVVFCFVAMALSGVVIFGALKMKGLTSYPLALAASIAAMLPCWGCCCVGLPVGIWSLVILMDQNVKAAFRS